MSDIEDYFSGDDSDSVVSIDSAIELNKKKKLTSKSAPYDPEEVLEKDETDLDVEGEELVDADLEDVEDIEDDDENDDEDDEDDDDDEDDEDEEDEEDIDDYYDEQEGGAKEKKNTTPKKNKKNTSANKKPIISSLLLEIEEEEEDNDENYLQKFDQEINQNYVKDIHPESIIHNYEEVKIMSTIVRDSNNIIIDPFHKTIPFLTKYERARILGQRAKQIEVGSKPFIKIPENIMDGYIIAEMELQQKKIPFIIRRPLPNGGCEYWNLRDLEIISF
jgi:DNA-directed RNA polymerase I, II, and III subunit RPABC2